MIRRPLASLLVVTLASISGFFEQWIPSIIPTEWAEIAPMEWTVPEWNDTAFTIAEPAEPLDPEAAEGFLSQRISNDAVGVQARYLITPDRSTLNDLTLGRVRTLVTEQADAVGTAYTPQAHDTLSGMDERGCVRGSTLLPLTDFLHDTDLAPPRASGVSITCDVMAATGPMLVQRVRTVTVTHETTTDEVVTLITDTVHDQTVSGTQLWQPDSADDLWNAIITTLKHDASSLSTMPITSTPDDRVMREILESSMPTSEGTVQVVIPAGFTAPELEAIGVDPLDAPVTMTAAPEHARTLLSGSGNALIAAVSDEAAFEAPPFLLAGHRSVDCALVPCVALTYDDGPSPLTTQVLDALAEGDASATFFVVGQEIEDNLGTVHRTAQEGHLILGHTWSHADLVDLEKHGPKPDEDEAAADDSGADDTATDEATENADADAPEADEPPTKAERHAAVKEELTRTNELIAQVTGLYPAAFRPPYGEVNDEVLKIAGMPAIQWDVDTEDWKGVADEVLISTAVTEVRPGSIVLQHDIHENTARTVSDIIDGLTQRGYTVVNIRQLFGEIPKTGEHFSAR